MNKKWVTIVLTALLFTGFYFSSGCVSAQVVKEQPPSVQQPAKAQASGGALDAFLKDPKKQTKLQKYVTAQEAYQKWLADPNNVKILDCRTPEEYIYVGHAPMAHNIPFQFTTYKFDPVKKAPVMKENQNFVPAVKARFKSTDMILTMCRSGHRSANSANKLAENGFTNVYNILDGFEGDMVKDPSSYYNGQRMHNGWKNSGAPWTYSLDPKLMYLAE